MTRPPPKGAVQRLEKMLARLLRGEMTMMSRYGPSVAGTMRAGDILDAKAIARVLEYLKAQG